MSTSIKGLNYADMGISGTKQLGSNTEVQDAGKTNLKDGLSEAELKKIDTNDDGVITEKEYLAACKKDGITDKNAKNYWQTLTLFTQATSKAGKNGSSTVSQKDSTGRTIETEFDKAGNVVSKKITATDNSTVTTTYNAKGKPQKTTYSNGNEIKYEYDSKNKLTKQTLNRANGTKKVTEYTEEAAKNEDGTLSSKKDKTTTVTEYDTNNNQKSKTVTHKDSRTNVTSITVFDENNEIVSMTHKQKTGAKTVILNEGNTSTTTQYDNKNKQISKIVSLTEDNKNTSTRYDANNKLVSQEITEETKNLSTKTYINNKNIKTVETINKENGNISKQRFDANGNQISVLDTINGEFDEHRFQGSTGDCWFIAGLNSLNSTEKGKQAISNAITKNSDGTVTVNFKGIGKSYTVTAEEIDRYDADYTNFHDYSNGDNDLLVLEIAYDKVRQETKGKDITGGYHEEIFEALTGVRTTKFGEAKESVKTSAADIDSALDAAMKNKNLALGFSLFDGVHQAKQTNGSIYKFEGGYHAFSITNVTENSVTFVNPWDSTNEITMNRAEFKKLGITALMGSDMKNLDTNNIQILGTLDKTQAKQLINDNSCCFIEIFNFFDSGNKITKEQRYEIMNELKSKLSNGKTISDITSFVNTYAASKKLDNASKTVITNTLKALSGGNTLSKKDIANGLIGVVIAGNGAKNSENLKTILNKLQTSSDISTLVKNINETGISSYNTTDIKTLLKAVGGSNNKIDNNEYTKLANTIFNNLI